METQDKDVRRVFLRHLHKGGPGMICVDTEYVKIGVYPESRISSHVSHKNPRLKKFFLEGQDHWFGLPIYAEIYKKATGTDEFEYLATALPFEQQPKHTKELIEAFLSKLEGSTERQLSFTPAEQKTAEVSFQLPEDLIAKINAARYDEDALARFGVDARRFRNAFAKEALETAYERLKGELPTQEIPLQQLPAVGGTEGKRSSRDYVYRGWHVRNETASRLKSYVNRQQEEGKKIDASDIVQAALNQFFDSSSIVPKTAEADPVTDWHKNAIVQIFENDGGVIDKKRNRYHAEIFRKKAQELSISQLDLTYLLILNSMQDRPKNFFLLEVEDAKV